MRYWALQWEHARRTAAMRSQLLQVGDCIAELSREIFELAVQRRPSLSPLAVNCGEPSIRLLRCGREPEGGSPLDPDRPELGKIRVSGSELQAWIPDDPYAAEAAVRAVWALFASRRGGLLVHACAVHWPGTPALVAIGRSGAGKSTLARLSKAAGAVVLSDETVALLPDARCLGTPFASDSGLEGKSISVSVSRVVVLEKALHEDLRPLSSTEALKHFSPQVYSFCAQLVGGLREVIRRLSVFAPHFGVLAFRNEHVAGRFVRSFLSNAST